MGTMKKKFTTKRKFAAENVVEINDDDNDDDVYIENYVSPKRRPKFKKPKD